MINNDTHTHTNIHIHISHYDFLTAETVWVTDFLSVDRNGKLMLAIMKKMALALKKCILEQNFKLSIPTKFETAIMEQN